MAERAAGDTGIASGGCAFASINNQDQHDLRGTRRAVQAHYELAAAYLDRIHGDEPRNEGGLFGSRAG